MIRKRAHALLNGDYEGLQVHKTSAWKMTQLRVWRDGIVVNICFSQLIFGFLWIRGHTATWCMGTSTPPERPSIAILVMEDSVRLALVQCVRRTDASRSEGFGYGK